MGGVEEGPHAAAGYPPNGHANGVVEEKLDELRRQLGKADGDPLRVVGIGAGAWGSVFCALLQDAYGHLRDKVQVRIWCRTGRAVDRATAEHLFEVINAREDVLRRLIRRCAYLKYVWDADIVINGLPSTEASLDPVPRIITPTQMISNASMVAALTNESATSNQDEEDAAGLDGTTVLGPCRCHGR